MDRNVVKSYATWARNELITRVTLKAATYGIEKGKKIDKEAVSYSGHLFTEDEIKKRKMLIEKIESAGFDETIEEISYTWFNRFAALRFMEVNSYLPSKVRVFTDDENRFNPEILKEALTLEISGINPAKVVEFEKNSDRDGLFRYLVITECNALGEILPGMFEKLDDYTELLFPDNLLRDGSVICKMIEMIPEESWKNQVQIIGWLYQYYNTELKDEVFEDLKRNKKITKERIPAATQLFTPDWIVRYMVENSLGKLWMLGHEKSEISKNWRYYLQSPPQQEDTWEKLVAMRENYRNKNPEDIRCIDPCVGSGHVLCYLFDVLVEIYISYGYRVRDAVKIIIEKNIYGLDIDRRATQLAYFSVMMKGREYDKRFFQRDVIPYPNIYPVYESNLFKESSIVGEFIDGDREIKKNLSSIIEDMWDAEEYGSIIDVRDVNFSLLHRRFEKIGRENSCFSGLLKLVKVAEILSMKYDVVVTNPPYMGSFGMNQKLQKYVKKHYKESKLDLFAVFIEKWCTMLKPYGFNAMVTMQSWMFLSGYEELRKSIFENVTISSLLHMDIMVMGIAFGTSATIFVNMPCDRYQGRYSYITMDDLKDGVPVEFPIKEYSFPNMSLEHFKKIPGIPIAYWVNKKVGELFSDVPPMSEFGDSKSGMQTGNNDLFLKMWYEVNFEDINFGIRDIKMCSHMKERWIPQPKGGMVRKWYGNLEYVVNFANAGHDLKNYKGTALIKNPDYYFKEGATWSHTTSSVFSARYMPPGCIFNVEAPTFYNYEDHNLFYILGFMNTRVFDLLFGTLSQTMHYMAGDMAKIPLVYRKDMVERVEKLVKENISLAKLDWDMIETSWDFKTSPLVAQKKKSLKSAYESYKEEVNRRFERVKSNEEELNRIFIEIYGVEDEVSCEVIDKNITVAKIFDKKSQIGEEIKGNRYILTCEDVIKHFISYAVGCMFGRYSLDSFGILFAGGRFNLENYKTFSADSDGLIPVTEDEYFADDIGKQFVEFVEKVFGRETLEENLEFIGENLRGKGTPREKIRDYFVNDFYKDHCKLYQKRPIYWQFDSGKKNGLKVLSYIHSYRRDSVARIRIGYVHEIQGKYAHELERITKLKKSATTSEKIKIGKKIADIRAKIDELIKFEEKIHHIADSMIELKLDDGVKKNYGKFGDILGKILR